MLSNYYHLRPLRKLRTFARRIGLLAVLHRAGFSIQAGYEKSFHFALKNASKSGDVIWDIGANAGLYTREFLEWSAPTGSVVAFEPFPPTFETLKKTFGEGQDRHRLNLQCVALSDRRGKARFEVERTRDGELISTTAHLVDDPSVGNHCREVDVDTVDDVRRARGLPIPNVVKIDVEGFEEEVLKGGVATFSDLSCRHVLVEVHFSRIEQRGLGDAAARIVKMLKQWGYTIGWVDASHLHAGR